MHINLKPILYNQSLFIFNVGSIPTHPSQTMSVELYIISIPCHLNYQPSHIKSHAKILPRLSFTTHASYHSCIFIHFILRHNNPTKHVLNTQKQRWKQYPSIISPNSRSGREVLLRRGSSRPGELLLPKRGLDKLEQWPSALARLGEISSPERGLLSFKTKIARLSDSSRKRLRTVFASLA